MNSRGIPKGTPGGISEGTTGLIPEGAPEGTHERILERISKLISEGPHMGIPEEFSVGILLEES